MIDPLTRWAAYGEKPDYAGLMSFAGLPYTEDPAELAGADVAIVGAPMDELTSDAPGRASGRGRSARRAARPAATSRRASTRCAACCASSTSATRRSSPPTRCARIRRSRTTVGEVLAAGAVPIVLGGDHSIAEPDIRACAAVHGPVGLIHFDAHTDTGREVFGVELSHGSPMYRLVESGHVDPSRYVQIGLRGYWPGEEEFAWQREHGITSHFMHDVRDRGIRAVVADTLETIGDGPVFVRSTSTCSTPPSPPAPARRSPAA